MPEAGGVRVAFLDRDGVLNRKLPAGRYVRTPAELQLVPGVRAALSRLASRYALVLVTNQRGIARGLMTEGDYQRVNDKLVRELRPVRFRAQFHCPHEIGSCDCRKPLPGMLLRAFDVIPSSSPHRAVLIGDSVSDVQAARAAGVQPILIGDEPALASASSSISARTLDAAVQTALDVAQHA